MNRMMAVLSPFFEINCDTNRYANNPKTRAINPPRLMELMIITDTIRMLITRNQRLSHANMIGNKYKA